MLRCGVWLTGAEWGGQWCVPCGPCGSSHRGRHKHSFVPCFACAQGWPDTDVASPCWDDGLAAHVALCSFGADFGFGWLTQPLLRPSRARRRRAGGGRGASGQAAGTGGGQLAEPSGRGREAVGAPLCGWWWPGLDRGWTRMKALCLALLIPPRQGAAGPRELVSLLGWCLRCPAHRSLMGCCLQ